MNTKQTRFFTFGQAHVHSFAGRTVDKDTVIKITAPDPRAVMVELFGQKWLMEYPQHWGPLFTGDTIEINR